MPARFHPAVFSLGLLLALSPACGRGDGFDGFSIGGLGGGTPSGTGRSSGAGPGGSGGNSGGTFGAGSSGAGSNGAGSNGAGPSGENGSSNGGIGSGSGGPGASGGFTSGIGTGATNGGEASGSSGAGTGAASGGSSGGIGTNGSNGGSATNGGASGGTGGSGGDGGEDVCDKGGVALPLSPCTLNHDCACPMICANDPFEGQVCEFPCIQTSDCPGLTTFCNGSNCQVNTCGGDTGNGSFNSFCDVVGVNDGTCTPIEDSTGALFGICSQGGNATVCCDPTADRSEPENICIAGMACAGGGLGKGGVCGDACDPSGQISCPPGQGCAITVNDPAAGACFGFPTPQCN